VSFQGGVVSRRCRQDTAIFLKKGGSMYFEAIFNPSKKTEYNSDAENLMGKKIAVQDGWIIEDGPHKGQHCFYMPNSTVGTIPESDLKELKNIPYVQWKQLHDRINL
jgi:hypothetical protein